MSQKKTKSTKKHTVKEVLLSLQWTVRDGHLELLCPITDEFVKIDLAEINGFANKTQTDGEIK